MEDQEKLHYIRYNLRTDYELPLSRRSAQHLSPVIPIGPLTGAPSVSRYQKKFELVFLLLKSQLALLRRRTHLTKTHQIIVSSNRPFAALRPDRL